MAVIAQIISAGCASAPGRTSSATLPDGSPAAAMTGGELSPLAPRYNAPFSIN